MAYDPYGCSLYVGNLNQRVCTELLEEVFCLVSSLVAMTEISVSPTPLVKDVSVEPNRDYFLVVICAQAGQVSLCKVVGDKNTGQSLGFGFVDFADRQTAAAALEKFNGRTIYGQEMRVDWAHTGTGAAGKFINPNQEDVSGHYCLFIGNLSADVDDGLLFEAFSTYGSCSSVRCADCPPAFTVAWKRADFSFAFRLTLSIFFVSSYSCRRRSPATLRPIVRRGTDLCLSARGKTRRTP